MDALIESTLRPARVGGGTRTDLSGMALADVPPSVFVCTHLADLSLSNNDLEHLPGRLPELHALRSLQVSFNRFAYFPDIVSHLAKLEQLFINHNQITEIEAPVFMSMGSLERFAIANNLLGSLPPTVGKLAALRELDVSHNRLTTLPAQLSECRALHKIYATGNQLETLPAELGELPKLVALQAAKNRLEAVPHLPHLQQLSLSQNPLQSLDALSRMRQLQHLYLSECGLTEFPAAILDLHDSLQSLTIDHNQLRDLPDGLVKMTRLREINLTYNELTSLSPHVAVFLDSYCKSQTYLAGNPLASPLDEILESDGPTGVLKHIMKGSGMVDQFGKSLASNRTAPPLARDVESAHPVATSKEKDGDVQRYGVMASCCVVGGLALFLLVGLIYRGLGSS